MWKQYDIQRELYADHTEGDILRRYYVNIETGEQRSIDVKTGEVYRYDRVKNTHILVTDNGR